MKLVLLGLLVSTSALHQPNFSPLGLRQKREFHHPMAFHRDTRYRPYTSASDSLTA